MPELRTYKGKHTVAEWWGLAAQAQKSRRKIELFPELIKPGDLVFDIGANRGMMTMVFRKPIWAARNPHQQIFLLMRIPRKLT